jgi:hypothetical protein
MLAILIGTVSSAWCYEVIAVSEGGTLTGSVRLEGQIPKPKGYNLTTLPDPYYCGRISDGRGWRILQPFNIGSDGKFRDVVVYLEGVKKGKPFEDGGIPQIEAKDCLFLPFTMVVRDDQSVTVVNMDPVMHDIQAYETSHLGARTLFNVPLPKKELVTLSKGRRIFVMQCGFHAYMESWGLAVHNPYFSKTDEQGRFTITDVPPGTYKVVMWHPYIRTVNEQAVTIEPKRTTEADFTVLAPTGRLYVNEALEHDYGQYGVTEEQKKEIEPMVHTQEH